MGVDTQVVTSRSEQQKQLDTVTDYINKKNGDDIKEIIGLITKDLIYTTDMEKYLSRTNDKDLDYDSIHIDYRKNREIEIHCSRHSRADLGPGRSEAEYFTLHITQGSENADITIEAKGPSSIHNKDLLLERVGKFDFNYIMKEANEMYKNLTQPPVAVAPVAVVPPKPTNASPPASDKPLSMAERIALFNKKGGRRSRRKGRKSRKSHKKSRKSHKKSRKSQRRQ
jgi:hypothetical protein